MSLETESRLSIVYKPTHVQKFNLTRYISKQNIRFESKSISNFESFVTCASSSERNLLLIPLLTRNSIKMFVDLY